MNWKQALGTFAVVIIGLIVYTVGMDAYNKHKNGK